jgi:hypothetical protein
MSANAHLLPFRISITLSIADSRSLMQLEVVRIAPTLTTRIVLWCLAYLWTAIAALATSYFADWQYDGGVGWWLVAVYSFPALALATPMLWVAGYTDFGATCCLAALVTLTAAAVVIIRRRAKQPTGS